MQGSATNNNQTWNYGTFKAGDDICNPDCSPYDQISAANVEIDPGPAVSRITNSSVIYSPNNGNLSRTHYEGFPLCYASQESCQDPSQSYNYNLSTGGSGSNNGPLFMSSDPSLYGDRISHGLVLWTYSAVLGGWNAWWADTDIALCPTTSGACVY